ncbi:hypothetical protein CV944_06440 [Geobacillus sp. WSUCF-018B]|nr:hypothetical protein CV944_06440 [Geobacillus sp. WSUCF-018B]
MAKVGRLSPYAALTFYIGAFFGSLIGKFNFLSLERKKRRLGASALWMFPLFQFGGQCGE